MKKLLWLDDIRDPNDDFFKPFVALYNPFLNQEHKIIWVKNFDEFQDYVINHSAWIDAISFDHDLAPEHYDSYIDSMDYEEKTGYDCLKWLCNYCYDEFIGLPKCIFHTANPVGKENMINYLKNVKEHWEL